MRNRAAIEEIGIGLYLELLERAVQALREGREPDLEGPLHSGPEIELQLPALLPDDYVADVHLRLQQYRRIAAAATSPALDDLRAEVIDRFGPLPPPARNLFEVQGLKLQARQLGLRRLQVGATTGLVEFAPEHRVDPVRVIRLIQGDPRHYRMDGPQRLRFSGAAPDTAARFALAVRLLGELGAPGLLNPN